MIKRLIFDVDGTLITGVNFIKPIEETLKKLNIYNENNIKSFLKAISTYEKYYDNYNKKDYIKYFENSLGTKLDDKFLNIFFEELRNCVPLNTKRLEKTIEVLANKYELVLLTNYFKESQLNRLNTIGISHLFLDCFGEQLIKPNNEIYLMACGSHEPNECVMIGDDLCLDIMKAKENGLNTIFVNSKNQKVNMLDLCVVNKVEDISCELIESILLNE